MQPKKPKSVWTIKDTEDGKFFLVDNEGKVHLKGHTRYRMSEYAFDHGADEVRHEYDLVKYDGSGSQI